MGSALRNLETGGVGGFILVEESRSRGCLRRNILLLLMKTDGHRWEFVSSAITYQGEGFRVNMTSPFPLTIGMPPSSTWLGPTL